MPKKGRDIEIPLALSFEEAFTGLTTNITVNRSEQCSRCHVCNGSGRAFGPDLAGIGRKYTRAQLLEQIIFPSKFMVPWPESSKMTWP